MATFKILLYKQKTLKDGTHPIVLQLTHKSKPYRISLGYKCKLEQWDFDGQKFRRNMTGYQVKNGVLREQIIKAEKVLDDIRRQGKTFTPQYFRELLTGVNKEITVFGFFKELTEEMNKEGKIGNRNIYRDTSNVIKRFWKSNKTLMFPDIDYTFLKKLETFLFGEGCSGGGISVYMRTLRAAINEAIRRGYMDKDLYPFSTTLNKNGYSISHLKSVQSPRALSLADMDKIKNFPFDAYPHLKQSGLYFLFSYYCRGMNFKDMALLKWSDIYDNRITYTREKTGGFFTIPISENIQSILNEFPKTESEYIFPILNDFHKTPAQVKTRVKKRLKVFNGDLKEIAKVLGINVNITSYVARHTYATTLKKKKVDVSLISESLGHADVMTTKAYLKKFEDTELDKLDSLL